MDYGVKDSMNMGACMAPAAADVIYNNLGFKDCYKFSITDYEKEQFEQLWKKKEEIM